MLPSLMAEETLDRATAAALGAGTMKPAEARRLTATLQRQAVRERGRSAPPDPRRLAFMGIEVREIP